MTEMPLARNPTGHLSRVILELLRCGWSIDSIPDTGRVPRNGLKLILRTKGLDLKLRVFGYKVTTSGRSRSHERRIEITTTYQSGLASLRGFRDVVLGWDEDTDRYVGVDSRRLRMGGATHNASSFFDLEGLSANTGELLINPRPVNSSQFPNGIEHHAFFDRSRLSEYLINQQEIHSGRYAFEGAFSGPVHLENIQWPDSKKLYSTSRDILVLSSSKSTIRSIIGISPEILSSVEARDFTSVGNRKITPAQLKQIIGICEEVGILGEQAVLSAERKRLSKCGFKALASKVERVSTWSVGEGYDILSFENDGSSKRYLEVKTTIGSGNVVDISSGEWNAAERYGNHYYIVRVINIRDVPRMFYICDPVKLAKGGKISRVSSGWRVDLGAALEMNG